MRVEEVVEGGIYLLGYNGVFEVTGLKKVRNNSLSPEVTMVVGVRHVAHEDDTGLKSVVQLPHEMRPRELGGVLAGDRWQEELDEEVHRHNLNRELTDALEEFFGFSIRPPHNLTDKEKRAAIAKLKRRRSK